MLVLAAAAASSALYAAQPHRTHHRPGRVLAMDKMEQLRVGLVTAPTGSGERRPPTSASIRLRQVGLSGDSRADVRRT
jgi:hypothetical protein